MVTVRTPESSVPPLDMPRGDWRYTPGPADWRYTRLAEDRYELDLRYEEPDEEALHGRFEGRHMIARDTPINLGVYVVPGTQEAIVVDDQKYPKAFDRVYSFLLDDIYNAVEHNPEVDLITKLLIPVYDAAVQAMPYDRYRTEEYADQFIDSKVTLNDFMAYGFGVCRHQALLAAYLLERLQKSGELMSDDQISVDRNTIPGRGGHAWVRYTSSDGTVYIIDSAQHYVGRLEDADPNGWDYRRPDDE